MLNRQARGATTRTVTLVLSVVVALGILGAIVYSAITGRGVTPAGTGAMPEPPREIAELLDPGAESGRGMTIQIADKDDPTRLAAEVLAERYDPDGPMHRRVEMPRAWLFGEDGSSWYIEADRGRFFIPEGSETPREGYLEGNVRARRYEAAGAGGGPGGLVARAEPGVTPASLTATTDAPLRFNLDMLHFETDGRLEVLSEQIEFAGHGAYVVLNEQRESITALRVDRGERLVYTPATTGPAEGPGNGEVASDAGEVGPQPAAGAEEPRPGDNGTPPPAADAAAGTGAAPTQQRPAGAARAQPAAATPKVDLYEITFEDGVVVQSGTRSVRSDLLTVWTRLVDNKIPERSRGGTVPAVMGGGAVGVGGLGGVGTVMASLASAALPSDAREPAVSTLDMAPWAGPVDAVSPVASEPETAPTPAEPAAQEPVVLTWSGPLEIAPLGGVPEPLSMGDDVALRFDAEEGLVRFEDGQDGAFGLALSAFYFAGRERIELNGPGGQVEFVSPGAGMIRNTSKLAIELAAGYVSVPAPGEMLGAAHDDTPGAETPQRVRWSGSAAFEFEAEDGRMTDRLTRASFEGDVLGENEDATLRGSRLDALFAADRGDSPRLVQLNVSDARATDGRGGGVSGSSLEVHFAPGTGGEELDPKRAIVTGSALARRDGAETIRADRIDAALGRDDGGDVIVTIAEAEGGVEFDDGAGVSGRGAALWADALAEHAVLTGEGAIVRRDSTEIAGPRIELKGRERSVDVDGAGRFAHTDLAADGTLVRSMETTWTERMRFDDLAGRVECEGGVEAETIGPDRTRDTVLATRIVMSLDPAPEDGEAGDFEQRLREAIAYGAEGSPAMIESRRVAADSPEDAPRVDELFRLEGGEIRLAARENRLDVPGAGKLFVLDRRPDTDDSGDGASAGGDTGGPLTGPGGARGTSLFTWAGSMSFDRSAGLANFERQARAANKPLGAEAITEVSSDRLTAKFTTVQPEGEPTGPDARRFEGDLLWAEAVGSAVLRIEGRREIFADRLLYHPEDGVIEAASSGPGRVSVQDLMRGTSSSFAAMRWNLATDRIDLIQPGSVVTPE